MITFILIIIALFCIAICASIIGNKKDVPQAKSIKDIGKRPYMPTKSEREQTWMASMRLEMERERQREMYTDWNLGRDTDGIDYSPNVTLGNIYRAGEVFNVDTTDMFPYDKNKIYRIFGNQIVKATQNGKDFAIYGIDLTKESEMTFTAKGFKKSDNGFIDPMGNAISLNSVRFAEVENNNNLVTHGNSATVSYDGNKIYFTLKGRDTNKLVLLWGK